MNFDKELDARGLNCPLPILRAKKTLAELQPGQVLRKIATDPGSVKDFAAFAKQTGNELLGSGEKDKEFEFFLKRKYSNPAPVARRKACNRRHQAEAMGNQASAFYRPARTHRLDVELPTRIAT